MARLIEHTISLLQPIRARASISAANRLKPSSPITTPWAGVGAVRSVRNLFTGVEGLRPWALELPGEKRAKLNLAGGEPMYCAEEASFCCQMAGLPLPDGKVKSGDGRSCP